MRPDSDVSNRASSWDDYWSGSGPAAAFSSDGDVHPAIAGFWSVFFSQSIPLFDRPRIIDIASGNAALVSHALSVPGADSAVFTCVDISETAIAGIRSRFPDVRTLCSDAADTGLPSRSFDIVTSQFGIEYAGSKAMEEAMRLLGDNGQFACLMHHTGGAIHLDCAAGLDAVSRVRDARLIPLAIKFFSAGFDAVRGADRSPYERAARELNPALRTMEEVVDDHGPDVAGGAIANLYNDVKRMHQNIQRHDPSEVLEWLGAMDLQLEHYVNRMTAMTSAALNEKAFAEFCGIVSSAGCEIQQQGPLFAAGDERPLAWTLLASR